MEVIVVGSGFEGIHFLFYEDRQPQIIIFSDNHLAVECREVIPSDMVGILKEIPPNNNEFLIEKLKILDENNFVFLLEKEPTEQHEFCFEKNTGNQNDCHSIETKNCCRSRSPPRAEIYFFRSFLFPFFSSKTKGLLSSEQFGVINKHKKHYKPL